MSGNPYRDGVEWLMAAGVGSPTEDRVLLKAILATDRSVLAEGINRDTLNAACHEVVGLGPEVKDKSLLGKHVIHLSAAADAADHLNPNARYLFVRERHISYSWDPAEAEAKAREFGLIS